MRAALLALWVVACGGEAFDGAAAAGGAGGSPVTAGSPATGGAHLNGSKPQGGRPTGSSGSDTGDAGAGAGEALAGAGGSGAAGGASHGGTGTAGSAGTSAGSSGTAGAGGASVSECTVAYPFHYKPEPTVPVHVSGSFTNWAEPGIAMTDHGDGVFSAVVALPPGRHLYKFVLGDQPPYKWVYDPVNPDKVSDEFLSYNSVLNLECPSGDGGAAGVSGTD